MTEIDFMVSRAAIDKALSQLSADSFVEAVVHSLARQQALNQRLLSALPKGKSFKTGLYAGDENERKWTVWGSFFGTADNQRC